LLKRITRSRSPASRRSGAPAIDAPAHHVDEPLHEAAHDRERNDERSDGKGERRERCVGASSSATISGATPTNTNAPKLHAKREQSERPTERRIGDDARRPEIRHPLWGFRTPASI